MRILSGIQPSGALHLGNYFGMMKPAIELQEKGQAFYFIADYHSMTSLVDPAERRQNTLDVALDFLACGLDPKKTVFFRQSDVPEVTELTWLLGTVTISIFCSTLTAYALARYPFPGREFFYFAVLALLMIPGVLTLITSFVVTVRLNLNNTFLGIWLPMAAGAQAFQIIVLRTYFSSLPVELFEAGRIDGAREATMLIRIALPLSKPIMSTLIVLQILGVWNEFIWPLMIFSNPDRYPAVLTVLRLGQLITNRDPGAMWAGYVIVGLPILIMFALTSRTFIRGLTSGAIKM